MTRNFQPAVNTTDDVQRTQAQQERATVGDNFANEAIERQRAIEKQNAASNKNSGWGFPNPIQEDALVFTVLDDLRLYGGEALDAEYATRDYDPYTLYKQSLFGKSDTSNENAA